MITDQGDGEPNLEDHLLPVLGDHGVCCVGDLALTILLHQQLGHRVEELGQVLGHHQGLVALGQDVQQVRRRGEVEPGQN